MILPLTGLAVKEGEKVLVLMDAVWEECFLAQHRQKRAKLLQQNEEMMVTQEYSFSATSLLLSRGLTNDPVSSMVESSLAFSLGSYKCYIAQYIIHTIFYRTLPDLAPRCRMFTDIHRWIYDPCKESE